MEAALSSEKEIRSVQQKSSAAHFSNLGSKAYGSGKDKNVNSRRFSNEADSLGFLLMRY
jgi:hypothetical protein